MVHSEKLKKLRFKMASQFKRILMTSSDKRKQLTEKLEQKNQEA